MTSSLGAQAPETSLVWLLNNPRLSSKQQMTGKPNLVNYSIELTKNE